MDKQQELLALAVIDGHASKWRKRSKKHVRKDGRRSDCEQRDIERARLCEHIARDVRQALAVAQPNPPASIGRDE